MNTIARPYAEVANYRLSPAEPGPLAIVLLHGLGGDLDQLWDLTEGRAGGRPAAVLAADARAHGRTELAPLGRLDFGVLATDVVALADRLRLGPQLVLVGVSMGAATAIALALREPARVHALVLVRPAWLNEPGPDNLAAFAEIAALLRSEGPARGRSLFEQSARYREVKALSPSTATSLLGQFEKPYALERVRRLEELPNSVPYHDPRALRGIKVATLVIAAPGDPVHPVPMAEELVAHIPRSRLALVTSRDLSAAQNQADLRAAVRGFLAHLGPVDEMASRL